MGIFSRILFAFCSCLALPFLSLATETSSTNIPQITAIMEEQWDIEQQIFFHFHQTPHSWENPMIVIDPYGTAPLTALALFETEEKVRVSVTILGKTSLGTLFHQFESYDTFHEIPLVGLYGGDSTTVQFILENQQGEQYSTTVQIDLPPLQNQVVPYSTGDFSLWSHPDYAPSFTDPVGNVRWLYAQDNSTVVTRISNGNLLVGKEDGSGFWELDLLGKLFADYSDPLLLQGDIVELPSGNFLLSSTNPPNYSDRLVELSRDSGEIVQELDLKQVLLPEEESLPYDWFQLVDLSYDEQDYSLSILGQQFGQVTLSYPSAQVKSIQTEVKHLRPSYHEPLSLYPSFWEYELLSHKGKIMAQNQQNVLQTWGNYKDYLLDTSLPSLEIEDFSIARNENYKTLDLSGTVPSQVALANLIFTNEKQSYSLPLVLKQNRFALSISYEDLWDNLPQGRYSLQILLETNDDSFLFHCDSYYSVQQELYFLENADLLQSQTIIADTMAEGFAVGNYTLQDPLIVPNPYYISPLTAVIAFQTEEKGTVEVTVHGKDADSTFVHKYATITDRHFVPVLGLYPDCENQVSLRFITEKGITTTVSYTILTGALPMDISPPVIEQSAPTASGLVFLSGEQFLAYDHNGDIRWFLHPSMCLQSSFTFLENGHFLFSTAKAFGEQGSTGFYEMDFLGKVHSEYIANGFLHSVQELENGDLMFPLSRDDRNTLYDYLVVMDRDTGAILETWDLYQVPSLNHYAVQTQRLLWEEEGLDAEEIRSLSTQDWFHMTSFYFDERDDIIFLASANQEAILAVDSNTMELLWIYDNQGIYSSLPQRLQSLNQVLLPSSPYTLLPMADSLFTGIEYQISDYTILESYRPLPLDTAQRLQAQWLSLSQEPEEEYQTTTSHMVLFYQDEGKTHLVEIKGEETIFSLTSEESWDYGQRQDLYSSVSHYWNLNNTPTRVGASIQTPYESQALPENNDEVDFSLVMSLDQGDRIALNLSFHNYSQSTHEKFIVLQNQEDVRCYPTQGQEHLFINKGGLESGIYSIGALVIDDQGNRHYTLSSLSVEIPLDQVPPFQAKTHDPAPLVIETDNSFRRSLVHALVGFVTTLTAFVLYHHLSTRKKKPSP